MRGLSALPSSAAAQEASVVRDAPDEHLVALERSRDDITS